MTAILELTDQMSHLVSWCLRVVRPSLKALRAGRYPNFAEHLRRATRDPLLDEFFDQPLPTEHRVR